MVCWKKIKPLIRLSKVQALHKSLSRQVASGKVFPIVSHSAETEVTATWWLIQKNCKGLFMFSILATFTIEAS